MLSLTFSTYVKAYVLQPAQLRSPSHKGFVACGHWRSARSCRKVLLVVYTIVLFWMQSLPFSISYNDVLCCLDPSELRIDDKLKDRKDCNKEHHVIAAVKLDLDGFEGHFSERCLEFFFISDVVGFSACL
jgi:hypothetical protein